VSTATQSARPAAQAQASARRVRQTTRCKQTARADVSLDNMSLINSVKKFYKIAVLAITTMAKIIAFNVELIVYSALILLEYVQLVKLLTPKANLI
jgi:hypothetical protein